MYFVFHHVYWDSLMEFVGKAIFADRTLMEFVGKAIRNLRIRGKTISTNLNGIRRQGHFGPT